jgi:hypothetical protein
MRGTPIRLHLLGSALAVVVSLGICSLRVWISLEARRLLYSLHAQPPPSPDTARSAGHTTDAPLLPQSLPARRDSGRRPLLVLVLFGFRIVFASASSGPGTVGERSEDMWS